MVSDYDLMELGRALTQAKPPPRAPEFVAGKLPVKRRPKDPMTPTAKIQSMFNPEEIASEPPFSY